MSDYYEQDDFGDIEQIGDEIFREMEYIPDEFINEDKNPSDDILLNINFQELLEDANREIEDNISFELESRMFQNDPNSFLNSRVGIAERIGQEQVLGTEVSGFGELSKRQKKIFQMTMSPEQSFKINIETLASKYEIRKEVVNELLDIIYKVPYFEYKNASGCLFGIMCLERGKINRNKLNQIYEKYAKENMTIMDLLRYSRFILNASKGL
jgi:hypothetical protein